MIFRRCKGSKKLTYIGISLAFFWIFLHPSPFIIRTAFKIRSFFKTIFMRNFMKLYIAFHTDKCSLIDACMHKVVASISKGAANAYYQYNRHPDIVSDLRSDYLNDWFNDLLRISNCSLFKFINHCLIIHDSLKKILQHGQNAVTLYTCRGRF